MKKKDLRVALVHDFLNQCGGAEKVLEVLCEMFPEAPIYTILYEKDKMHGKFKERVIYTSFFQKFPKIFRRRFKLFSFLLPVVPETFDLREYDLIISSSGAWSKGIIARLNTLHIAYIHSPMRFAWDYNNKYLKEERKEKLGFFIRPMLSYFRLWDRLAADRPDYLIANSKYTKERIKKYYRRESEVIYPPVSIESGAGTEKSEKYFLIVSRLSAYKKIDVAIEAFNKLGLPLLIVGEGKEKNRLEMMAEKNVKFMGWISEKELPGIYKNARAFVFPGVDDFGMAPATAQVLGIPVIALKKGGAMEIVEEGKTGELFDSSTPEVLADSVRRFLERENIYDSEYIKRSAEKFGKERFKKEISEFIERVTNSNF